MAARIRSLVNGTNAVDEASRDDLAAGDVVTLEALDTATTYAWTLVYVPEGSTASFSGDPTSQSPGSFTVDKEGPYLVRLTVDLGLSTESHQFVRLRYLTELGQLKLVAAGEQNAGSLPVPVDITTEGWANEQNTNLLTILGLLQSVVASGRILYVDPDGAHGDYTTIQDAIDAVSATATASAPWVIAVRPGTYTEDITFAPHVHVIGWPGARDVEYGVRLQCANSGGTGAHTADLSLPSDSLIVSNLVLVNVDSSVTAATLTKKGSGSLYIHRCRILQLGVGATVGPAVDVQAGYTNFTDTVVQASDGPFVDRYALIISGGEVEAKDTQVVGTSACYLGEDTVATFTDSRIVSTGGAGSKGIYTDARDLTLEYCRVNVASGDPLDVHTAAGAISTDVGLTTRWTFIQGDIAFDTTGMTGTSSLYLGSTEYGTLSLPGGSPSSLVATTKATTLFYDNSVSGMAAEDVQAALDEVYAEATLIRTLDDAYDAGAAAGAGRKIIADQGPVEILDSVTPADPPDPSSGLGGLRVTGKVEVGAIGFPEIDIDPNPYGNGPMVIGGQRVWADNAPHGSTFFLMARATGSSLYRNYNLRVQSESTDGGGETGWTVLRSGDALPNDPPISAGDVFVQAGSALGVLGGDGGDLYLAPGQSVAGTVGSLYFVRPQDGTPATLTAGGAFVGGVTGTVRFATDMGAIEVDIDAADDLATVLSKFNATNIVVATESGGVIQLTTRSLGPTAEIFYLNDTTGGTTDAALGGFDGQAQVNGTWPSYMQVDVTAADEISFGVGATVGPMVYNASTGKLTVPGVIDPTAVIFDEAAGPSLATNEGGLFVSDGSGGRTQNEIYYLRGSDGAYIPLSEGLSSILGVAQESFPASSFTYGTVSSVSLARTPYAGQNGAGLVVLWRNGVYDMINTGSVAPTTATEFRINGTTLEIGTDITGTGNTYTIMYPYSA